MMRDRARKGKATESERNRDRCLRRVFLSRIETRNRSGAYAYSCERSSRMLASIELLDSFAVAATQLSASLLILADSSVPRPTWTCEHTFGRGGSGVMTTENTISVASRSLS
ncbi:hypothetical protein AB1N83_007677 [Pleurotus pulmonarius]